MTYAALTLAAWALALAAAQDPAPAVLSAPEGFAVDLVDAAPNLLWPSAVHCRSDGSLLVAEDPMDMTGPTDQPLDRLWLYRWKPDGTFSRTLFAEKLYAAFGLEEIDGAVFVMNMPHLTVLRDVDGDGVAESRQELLTDLGPVAPGAVKGFNDHIVSGLRYGMDGWLYVAVGDKGVPLAHGTDGSTLSLRGGGIVRLRPDGSHLELVASGLRNVLDVAIDADGELFTYDNTDDGLGWWTRLTHVVPGGYYGYPWDYHGPAGRFLAPMAEYGGGSPTGGLVKREGGWPAPYEGSLFFCEWGDQSLRRFELARDGGTFKVAAMEEFLKPGKVENFRPTDVCESPDGRFLYVSDWGFGAWQVKNETGRLWRVRRSDDDGRAPGGVDARVGQHATIGQRLASDGWRARLLAQREIVRTKDLEALSAALHADERSALHGVYAAEALLEELVRPGRPSWNAGLGLAAINKFNGARLRRASANLGASRGNELREWPEFQAQRREAAEAEARGGTPWVEGYSDLCLLEDEADPAGSREALLRLVRVREGRWAEYPLARAAAWKVANESPIAMHAWRALASSALAPAQLALFFDDGKAQALELLDAIESAAWRKAEMRRGALEDGPPRGPFEDLEACGLLALARGEKAGQNPEIRAKALAVLAGLARTCEPWDGKWWSIDPAAKPRPARTVDWRGTEAANAALRSALVDGDPGVRLAAVRAARIAADARFLPELGRLAMEDQDHDVRKEVLDALGEVATAEWAGLFARIARKSPDDAERVQALRIGMRLNPAEVCQSALYLAEHDLTPTTVQAAALEALAGLEPEAWPDRDAVLAMARKRAGNSWPAIRAPACKLLAEGDPEAALPVLLEQNRDPAVHPAAFAALAKIGSPRTARALAQGLEDPDPALRGVARRAIGRSKQALRPALEGMVQRQEFAAAVVRELRAIYGGQQPILEWQVVGPCAVDGPLGKLDFSAERAAASLRLLEQVPAKRAVSERDDGLIDLRALLGGEPNQTAYAFGEFESAEEREVELHAGSDDHAAIWLNGVLVHEFVGARAFTAEEDRFRVHLLAGRNRVVARIVQIGGQWSFAVTVPEKGQGPLFESKLPAQPTAAEYAAFAAEKSGDAVRGKQLLLEANRTMCLRCHTYAGTGEHVGPDLTGIGARYSKTELLSSILAPSQRIADGYAAVSVLTSDDQLLFGQLKRDDAQGILLVDTTGTQVELAREDVAEIRASKQSVMPEGLCNALSLQEFADLLALLSRRD